MNAPADGTDAWHALRRQGVGGSDIYKILGLSSYDTPQELWALKTGRTEPKPSGPAAARGHACEPAVLQRTGEILRQQGHTVRVEEGEAFFKHPEWESGVRFQANSDGTLIFTTPSGEERPGILEAKTCGEGNRMCWFFQQHMIPEAYHLQVQAYMDAIGHSWGVISAMIGPRKHNDWGPLAHELPMVVLSFRAHPPLQELVRRVVADFWECIESNKEPHWSRHKLANQIRYELKKARARTRHISG